MSALVLRFASALVQRKVLPIEEVMDLRVLVADVERFKTGLRFFLDRFEGQSNAYIAKIADTLRSIAKYYVEVPEEIYDDIESPNSKLARAQLDELHRQTCLLLLYVSWLKLFTYIVKLFSICSIKPMTCEVNIMVTS